MRLNPLILPLVLASLLAGCGADGPSVDPLYGVKPSPRVVHGGPVRKGGGRYHVGKPYKIAGKWYHPKEDPDYRAKGKASWYGESFHGRLTANGEVFDMRGLSAAHPTLPLPSYVRVTNRANGHSVVVRVNDRGPFHGKRVIDVSQKAADLLDFRRDGVADVLVEYVGEARMDGEDDWLVTTAAVHGERMSPRMLASLGVDKRLLRRLPASEPTRVAKVQPSPVLSQEPQPAVAAWTVASTAPLGLGETAPQEPLTAHTRSTDVLVGAFSDMNNVQYVSGALGQFGDVELQPIAFGGHLLQHMTLRAADPASAQAALAAAHRLGASDARLAGN